MFGSITIKLNGFFYVHDDIELISVNHWWIEVLFVLNRINHSLQHILLALTVTSLYWLLEFSLKHAQLVVSYDEIKASFWFGAIWWNSCKKLNCIDPFYLITLLTTRDYFVLYLFVLNIHRIAIDLFVLNCCCRTVWVMMHAHEDDAQQIFFTVVFPWIKWNEINHITNNTVWNFEWTRSLMIGGRILQLNHELFRK